MTCRSAGDGRFEPMRGSDLSPETFHSEARRDEISERAGKDGSWPGPGFPGRRSKLTLAGAANTPKVRFLAPPRTHTGGHELSSDRLGRAALQDWRAPYELSVCLLHDGR